LVDLDSPSRDLIAGQEVSIQVSGFDAAVSDGWLRFGGKREAAVVAECGFRDDSGL
jgi:hypothetical protein